MLQNPHASTLDATSSDIIDDVKVGSETFAFAADRDEVGSQDASTKSYPRFVTYLLDIGSIALLCILPSLHFISWRDRSDQSFKFDFATVDAFLDSEFSAVIFFYAVPLAALVCFFGWAWRTWIDHYDVVETYNTEEATSALINVFRVYRLSERPYIFGIAVAAAGMISAFEHGQGGWLAIECVLSLILFASAAAIGVLSFHPGRNFLRWYIRLSYIYHHQTEKSTKLEIDQATEEVLAALKKKYAWWMRHH